MDAALQNTHFRDIRMMECIAYSRIHTWRNKSWIHPFLCNSIGNLFPSLVWKPIFSLLNLRNSPFYNYLPNALSLADPELSDAMPSGLCASWPGLDGVGGVSDVSRLSICICNVIWMVLLAGILYWWEILFIIFHSEYFFFVWFSFVNCFKASFFFE